MLPRVDDLGAVEPRRSVDAAVADQHDVVVSREAACVREVHVRDAGAALKPEDRRNTGAGHACADARDRKRDQARVRVVPVLADDERAAIGGLVLRTCSARVSADPRERPKAPRRERNRR